MNNSLLYFFNFLKPTSHVRLFARVILKSYEGTLDFFSYHGFKEHWAKFLSRYHILHLRIVYRQFRLALLKVCLKRSKSHFIVYSEVGLNCVKVFLKIERFWF